MRYGCLVSVPVLTLVATVAACQGPQGQDGASCSVEKKGNGDAVITCADGTSATVAPSGCSVTTATDGSKTIQCADGTTGTVADGDDGAPGQAGVAAEPCTVVQAGDASATITCPDGSVAIIGVPQDEVWTGTLFIQDAADIARAQEISVVDGDVVVELLADLTPVVLDKIRIITGTLDIRQCHRNLEMRTLLSVHDLNEGQFLDVPVMPTFPALHSIARDGTFFQQQITAGGLDALEQVGGTLLIGGGGPDDIFLLPELRAAGLVSLVNRADRIDLPKLETVGGFTIGPNSDIVQEILLPVLRDVTGINPNPGFVGRFEVFSLPSLTRLDAPNLVRVNGDFTVGSNPLLPQCAVDALQAQVVGARGIEGIVDVAGNDAAGTCN